MADSDPNLSRCFIVCGKSAEVDTLTDAFRRFGNIQSVKLVRDKGVAYVKFEKASSAAAAIEQMHETVLNDGRGPMLKVMLAEAPKSGPGRFGINGLYERELSPDPDNIPPLSRLFIVVPKTANGAAIEAEMSRYSDLQYCKTDLIASKGIVFCKYARSSSALTALEAVNETGMLAGYKVKCMLAEPKGKHPRMDHLWAGSSTTTQLASVLGFDRASLGSLRSGYPQSPAHSVLSGLSEATSLPSTWPPLASSRTPDHHLASASDYSPTAYGGDYALGGMSHLAGLQAIAAIQGAANLAQAGTISGVDFASIGKQVGLGSIGAGGMSSQQGAGQPNVYLQQQSASAGGVEPHTPSPQMKPAASTMQHSPEPGALQQHRSRLYVVCHKVATEQMLTQIFSVFPGLEYCSLKQDHATGFSKGFGYVGYGSPEVAAAAVYHLNGIEFPAGSNQILKVMFAEPLEQRSVARMSPGLPPLSDSTETLYHLRSSPSGTNGEEEGNSGRHGSEESITETLEQRVESLSMSRHAVPLPRQPLASPTESAVGESEAGEWEAESKMPTADGRTVFTFLTRPLPTYALEHYFGKCGLVDSVCLQVPDERYGIVRFRNAEAARAALEHLDGSEICGECLAVLPADPLQDSRNMKRARVAK